MSDEQVRQGDGGPSYGSYLALDALLALQHPLARPEHPDELLFIVVHQASELWFKVILHELDTLVQAMGDRVDERSIKRVVQLVVSMPDYQLC